MWIWIVLAVVSVFWGMVAVAACRVAGQISRMEELEDEIDARARELLKDIDIDLKPVRS